MKKIFSYMVVSILFLAGCSKAKKICDAVEDRWKGIKCEFIRDGKTFSIAFTNKIYNDNSDEMDIAYVQVVDALAREAEKSGFEFETLLASFTLSSEKIKYLEIKSEDIYKCIKAEEKFFHLGICIMEKTSSRYSRL